MKKLIIIPFLMIGFVMSGCSMSLDINESKVDVFTEVAEGLEEVFLEAESNLKQLSEKPSFTSKDQQNVVQQIEKLTEVINKFQHTEAPFFMKKVKKKIGKILNEREENFLTIKEKAENGEVEKEDIELMLELLSDEIELNILSN